MVKNKKDLLFLIVIIIFHIFFYSIAVYQDNYFPFSGVKFKLSDSYQYLIEAENIISKGIFYAEDLNNTSAYKYYTIRPPGYPLFLAFFKLFNAPFYIILIFQNIISILSIYLVRDTILTFGYNKKYDFLFLLLIVLTPSQLIYANAILTEVLFQLFLVIMFRSGVLFHKNNKDKYLFHYSLALILAAFIKPLMYLFVIPSTIYMIWIAVKSRKWQPIAFSILPILAILFIFQWNFNRTKHYQYSSIQTINLIDYNTRFFLISRIGNEKADAILDSIHHEANLIPEYSKRMSFLDNRAKNIILENLTSYIRYHLQGSFYAILDPGRFDIDYFLILKHKHVNAKGILYHINNGGIAAVFKFLIDTYSLSLLLFLGIILFLNLLKFSTFIYFIFNKNIDLNFRFITASLFFYIVLVVGPVGASRYIMPLVPIIIGAILLNRNIIEKIINKLAFLKPKI